MTRGQVVANARERELSNALAARYLSKSVVLAVAEQWLFHLTSLAWHVLLTFSKLAWLAGYGKKQEKWKHV